ncbi:MAG: hypothetical protein ACLT38_13320 [Akkermansia sp.]
MAVALESCSVPVKAPEAVAGWYEGTLYEDKPFYITKNAISWTSGRKKADFGRWTAVSVYDPSIRMQAERRSFQHYSRLWLGRRHLGVHPSGYAPPFPVPRRHAARQNEWSPYFQKPD